MSTCPPNRMAEESTPIVCASQVSNGSYYFYTLTFENTFPQCVHVGHVHRPKERYSAPLRIRKNPALIQRWPALNAHKRETIIIQVHFESGNSYPFYSDGHYTVEHTYIEHGGDLIPILSWSSSKHLQHEFYILCHPAEKDYVATAEKSLMRIYDTSPIEIPYVDGRPRPPVLIYRGLMEGALYRKESCPVSYEDLTEDNVAILPCFHIFDKVAIARVPNKRCPVCRSHFEKADVVAYK